MAQFFEVLYWVAMLGMSIVLAGTTILICAIGFKFIKDKRRALVQAVSPSPWSCSTHRIYD